MIMAAGIILVLLLAWMQADELHALRIRAEEAEAWEQRWEELAAQAAEEAERVSRRHARLQELYGNLVRQRLAASSWIVVRGRETR